MAGTRSLTRKSDSSSPKQAGESTAATSAKRKAEVTSSPDSKREHKTPKKQLTIEQTIGDDHGKDDLEDSEMKDSPEEDTVQSPNEDKNKADKDGEDVSEEIKGSDSGIQVDNTGAVQESSEREQNMPSNILEKGLIYFFTRNRVGIEDSESVGDLSRTYWVLRPLPAAAKLGDGALPDLGNNRLFALPKKTFPKSHRDRFMAFVEQANVSIQDLKDSFFKGEDYETKTLGTRHTEPINTVGEGVYAITRTENRTTHLVYALTIPTNLGEVQEDLGLKSHGSFAISVKNPERSGPASARLPQDPGFPKEIIEEFRGLAWSEVKPNYLDYANCQILLIGEDMESATEPTTKDKKTDDKETPKEELEQLEHEDELRVEHLHGDESIFDDLKITKEEYDKVPTTW